MGETTWWLVYKKVIIQLLLLLLIFQGIRLLFVGINYQYFPELSIMQYLRLVVHSLRFDLSAVISVNLLYIFLSFIPFSFVSKTWYQQILNGLFVITNSISFMFELADIGYFPFVRKRMTAEVFHLIGRKSDFIDLLPSYLKEFWYVPLAALIFIAGLIYLNHKVLDRFKHIRIHFSIKTLLFFIVSIGISTVIIRGGLQLKPMMNNNALLVASNDHVPIVLNTSFSILHTLEQEKLEILNDYTDSDLMEMYHPIKNYSRSSKPRTCNVVMIILESFGRQYTGIGGRKSYTPFLDSLMKESLVFSNAFANGHRSADGIPACIGGVPAFMNEAFTTSPYAGNKLDALPFLLKQSGYSSSFFHGGTNGTMSFDIYASNAGFDRYVGRTEYNHDQDYDGTWGIWDEPFLQYYANELGKERQPFFSTIFTLSSHEPFKIPEKYNHEPFASYQGIYRGISYSDMALKIFFQTARAQPWFKNTLFVITADHNFLANVDTAGFYNNGLGLYAVPVLFFNPSDRSLISENHKPMQQIDLLPTILDYLHYPYKFYAYGNSAFDSSASRFVYTQMGDHHQMMLDHYVFTSDHPGQSAVFDYAVDSLLKVPLLNDTIHGKLRKSFKVFKQILNNSMIDNKMSYQSFIQK